MEIKINGVYNPESIQFLKSLGVSNFGFDLRPKSFNFIQLHVIKDIIKSLDSGSEIYSFMFSNEKDFVINEVISQLSKDTNISSDRFLLEFTDIHDIDLCESFKHNYVWHFDESTNFRKIQHCQYLRVVSIAQQKLVSMQESTELYSFIKELNSLRSDSTLLSMRLDWNDSLLESISDFYLPNIITMEINNMVESSYRHINQSSISDHLNFLKQKITSLEQVNKEVL